MIHFLQLEIGGIVPVPGHDSRLFARPVCVGLNGPLMLREKRMQLVRIQNIHIADLSDGDRQTIGSGTNRDRKSQLFTRLRRSVPR
ncbi:hypothetical protein XI06_07090 [Bradyrhizobium sp. CCBAU 11434]|nr:hypothetical protein [Bradyrhizobium sp. CCBAU 11434]